MIVKLLMLEQGFDSVCTKVDKGTPNRFKTVNLGTMLTYNQVKMTGKTRSWVILNVIK